MTAEGAYDAFLCPIDAICGFAFQRPLDGGKICV